MHFLLFIPLPFSPNFNNHVEEENIVEKEENSGEFSPFQTIFFYAINPLPNYKILDWSKFKAFADD